MNDFTPKGNSDAMTMSSIDLLELVNASRKEHGENAIRRNDFHARVESELDGEFYETFVIPPGANGGRPSQGFRLTQDQCLLVSMRESKAVRRSILKKLKALEGRQSAPAWLENLSPQAKVVIEDLNSQVNHYRQETDRLNAVCNDLAENLKAGLTPVEFCRMLNGVNLNLVQAVLVERKRLLKTQHGYRSAAAYRDKLFTERRYLNKEGRPCEKVILTQKGAKWLYAQYEQGQLEMRKDWDGNYTHMLFENEEKAA